MIFTQPAWYAIVVPPDLLASHGGVSAIDIHGEGGTWFAFAAPVEVTPQADWSRVF